MRLLMCVLVVGAFLFLLWHFTRTGRGPDSALVRELAAAGVTPGESEKLLGSGHHWRAQRTLMTDREVYFMHDLFRRVDMQRWYLCPQVRVADIGVREWCWTMLLTFIPGVNLIFLAYWAFSSSVNQNKRNYARASWIFLLVVPLAGWTAFAITYMAYNP